ncbi:MAG: copper chaperone PCu(A)C [Nitrososphaerota archaeon]
MSYHMDMDKRYHHFFRRDAGLTRPVLLILAVVAAALVVVGVFFLFSGGTEEAVEVHGAFFRRGTMAAGVFFIAHNHGYSESCIVAAETLEPKGLRAELHITVIEGGVATMRKVEKICIPPRGEVRALGLEGEGYHVMILSKIPEGIHTLKIRLVLASGATVDFEAKEQLIETPMDGSHEGHSHDHGD